MQLICPDCLGTLSILDGKIARCTTHGGEYQVLFSHWKAPPPPPPPLPVETSPIEFLPTRNASCFQHPNVPATHICGNCGTPLCESCAYDGSRCCPAPAARRTDSQYALAPAVPPPLASTEPPVIGQGCAQHPNVRASFLCRNCSKPLCEVCAFKEADGVRYCPDCMSRRSTSFAPPAPMEMPPPAGARCVQHPDVFAARRCRLCGSFMCPTCDFVLPDGNHVCPKCATTPQTGLSRKRKKFLIAAYVAAIWSTIVFSAVMSGALSSAREDDAGIILLLFGTILIASITGLCFALCAKHRHLPNPVSVWIAVVWNGVILGGYLFLMLLGLLKQHG